MSTRTHDVVIVGAGPAGLAAATALRACGISDIVVLERESEPGGVPRHCGHTGFGWFEFRRLLSGPAYARRLARSAHGICLQTRSTVLALGRDGEISLRTPDGLATLRGRRVVLALGTRETPRSARLVSGTRPWGVTTTGALQQMVYLARQRPFTRAVVIGSELVSFSALLTLRHAGARALLLVEEGPEVLAPWPAGPLARAVLGVPVVTGTRVAAIHGTRRVEGVELERGGLRWRVDCDAVVFSGRFVPETAILRGSHLELDAGTGGPVVDQYGRCSDPVYFAAGNLLRPVEPSWTAWAEGRAVASAVAASLSGTLPAAARSVRLQVQPPLRYVCPQRIALPAPLPAALETHARVLARVTGELRAVAGTGVVLRQRVRTRPERRLACPVPLTDPGGGGAEIRLEIVATAARVPAR